MSMDEGAAASQLGCQYELQLYQAFSHTENLVVTYGKPAKSVTLTANLCSAEPISTSVVGGLYKLYPMESDLSNYTYIPFIVEDKEET